MTSRPPKPRMSASRVFMPTDSLSQKYQPSGIWPDAAAVLPSFVMSKCVAVLMAALIATLSFSCAGGQNVRDEDVKTTAINADAVAETGLQHKPQRGFA